MGRPDLAHLEIPQKMEKVLEQAPMIKDISRMFTYAHNFLYLGRGVNYPVAMEGALKLKEISYIHAEGYPAAEMKHGPIALVEIRICRLCSLLRIISCMKRLYRTCRR